MLSTTTQSLVAKKCTKSSDIFNSMLLLKKIWDHTLPSSSIHRGAKIGKIAIRIRCPITIRNFSRIPRHYKDENCQIWKIWVEKCKEISSSHCRWESSQISGSEGTYSFSQNLQNKSIHAQEHFYKLISELQSFFRRHDCFFRPIFLQKVLQIGRSSNSLPFF